MTEIGKVTIKVTPDTTGFGAKVKAALENLSDEKVTVKVKAEGVEKAKAEIEDAAKDQTAHIHVDVKQSELDKLKEKIAASHKAVGQSVLDPSFQSRLKQQLAQTTQAFEAKSQMVQNAARDAARSHIDAFTTRNDQVQQRIDIKAELDTAEASTKLAAWRARESIRNLHIKMELDTGAATAKVGAFKALSAVGNVGGGILNGLQGIAGAAGEAASGMRVFGVGAAAILAVAVLIPPALALISGALLVLPGALAGIAVPIATAILGFEGIKKAAENAGFLGAPNKKGKRGAGELFKELQSAVSDTFEQKLTPVFENATKILEPLKAALPSVAGGLSDMAKSFVDTVTSQVGMDRIQNTIQNIGQALTNAAPGLGAFTEGFINLADKVSNRFPGVGTAFTNLGNQFNNWITKFTSPDSNGVSDLDRSLTSLHDTWNQIAGLFSSDLIGKGFDFLKDPNFGKSMVDFVGSIRSLVQDSLPKLAEGFGQFSTILKPITDAFAPILKVLDNPLVRGGLSFLDPTKPGKQIADQFNPAATAGGQAQAQLDAAVEAAKKAGGAAAPAFKGAFDAAAGANGVFSLVPGGTDPNNAKVAQDTAKAQASDIIAAFGGGGALGASADIGVQLSANIQKATDAATAQLRTGLTGLGVEFQTQLAQIGTDSAAQIQAALTPIQAAPAAVQTAFGAVAGVIQGAFGQVVASVAQGASQIAVAVGAGFAQVPGVAMQAFGTLANIAAGGMAGLVSAVATGCAQAVATLQTLPQQIGAIGAQLFAASQAAGAQVGLGLAAGIAANAGAAVAAAQQLATAVSIAGSNTLKINSPSKVFRDMGYSINEGLADGIQEQGNLPVERLKEILQTVKDVFGDAKGLNLNFNLGGGTSTSGQVGALNSQINEASSNAKALGNNLNDAMTPVQPLTPDGKARLDEITQQLADLELQRKQLKVNKDAAGSKEDKKAIQAQIDQITSQKDILDLEKGKLAYAKKYGNEQWNIADAMNTIGKSTLDAGFSFAKSNVDQLQSDLGIGGGAITGGANALWDWGTKAASNFIFHVSNVDDAISVKNNQVNKEAYQFSGR